MQKFPLFGLFEQVVDKIQQWLPSFIEVGPTFVGRNRPNTPYKLEPSRKALKRRCLMNVVLTPEELHSLLYCHVNFSNFWLVLNGGSLSYVNTPSYLQHYKIWPKTAESDLGPAGPIKLDRL